MDNIKYAHIGIEVPVKEGEKREQRIEDLKEAISRIAADLELIAVLEEMLSLLLEVRK